MSLRFRKQVNLGDGLKLNINKKSIGLTGGVKSAHYTINSSGKKTKSVGIPGTGISYRSSSGGSTKSSGCFISSIKIIAVICLVYWFLMYAWIPALAAGIVYILYCHFVPAEINKTYIIIGALVFTISLGFFIYDKAKAPSKEISSPSSSSLVISSNNLEGN